MIFCVLWNHPPHDLYLPGQGPRTGTATVLSKSFIAIISRLFDAAKYDNRNIGAESRTAFSESDSESIDGDPNGLGRS